MKRVMSGIASLAGLLLFAGAMFGGLYLRSVHAHPTVGQADVGPTPTEVPSDSPTPTDMPSPTVIASPITPSPSRVPPPAAPPQPAHPAPTCPPLVITSFTGQAEPDAVRLSWTVSGGCGNETGSIGGQFGLTYNGPGYPGYWVIPVDSAWKTYTDHPQRPAASLQYQQCDFTLKYDMVLNGTAPDGRGVAAVFAEVTNVNLC